jgi:TolB-like protein
MSLTSFINKGLALVIVCILCGAGCAVSTQPAVQHASTAPANVTLGGVPRHIAVLPLVNMSGQPAPVKGMRQALIERLVAGGAVVLGDEDLEEFMVRHRMRNVDGIDSVTAQALSQETGMDSVIITTLEQYANSDPPAIAMTSRLVSTADTPIILWMEAVALSGDDSPGVLGLGLIHDMVRLQEKAFDRLTRSIELYLAGATNTGSGRGKRIFQPKTIYSSPFMSPGRKYSVVVVPFLNRSKRYNADSFLALRFMSQLTKEGTFKVIDPGAVREKFLFFRFIMREGLSVRQADILHDTLQADLIVSGKVVEYEDAEGTPRVEFNVLVFERQRKKVVWESWSFNRGDDGVFFFDWGRVSTASELASKMLRAVVGKMSTLGTFQDERLPAERSSMSGPWSLLRADLPVR